MDGNKLEFNDRSLNLVKKVILSIVRSYLIKTRKIYPFNISLKDVENEKFKDIFNIDSLDLLNIASEINVFFNIHKIGIEDKLLVNLSLENWTEISIQSLNKNSGYLTFSTSGSTGTPKLITHRLESIFTEAAEISRIVGSFNKVISLVPLHHIYGFLYSIALPFITNKDMIFINTLKMSDLENDILIVATPEQWKIYKDLIILSKKRIKGTSSTGILDLNLFAELINHNVQIYEFFGSTETLGLGYRTSPYEKFNFFSYLTVKDNKILNVINQEYLEPMDDLRIEGSRFDFVGRKDNAVSIGGKNIFLDFIKNELLKNELIVDCSVRSYPTEFGLFIKALIVPKYFDETTINTIKEYIFQNENTKYIKNIKFAEKVPVNELGKPSDWQI